MKRHGNLWPEVVRHENLLQAFDLAARGKRHKREVSRFAGNLDQSLEQMHRELENGTFRLGRYHVFKVYDPKERIIHAACFRERVFHHALIRVCEPILDRRLIAHSYACRKGKGRPPALVAAGGYARRNTWYVKLDIRKYFESIPHDRLMAILDAVFKDPDLMGWFRRIVASHHGGHGLPIGSLTSQHFANQYLAELDRFCLGQVPVNGYVRYMDDFVCWSNNKTGLQEVGARIEAYVANRLGLALKHPPMVQRAALGMDFLGARVFPSHSRLNRNSKVRYRRKVQMVAKVYNQGVIDEQTAQARLTALTAFALPLCSHRFRGHVLRETRSAAIGFEPGEPGRLLEQQHQELPLRVPQQQRPVQPERQSRLPAGLQLSVNAPDGVIRPQQGTEPAVVPIPRERDKLNTAPIRAGRSMDLDSNARCGAFFHQKETGA